LVVTEVPRFESIGTANPTVGRRVNQEHTVATAPEHPARTLQDLSEGTQVLGPFQQVVQLPVTSGA